MSQKMHTLTFTDAELRALFAVADEGLEGLGSDATASKAYLGGAKGVQAAQRAIAKIHAAFHNR